MERLAAEIKGGKRVVFVTGAGLSCASGIKPYRETPDAVWNVHDTKWCQRKMFVKDPEKWYREFWLRVYHTPEMLGAKPTAAHLALEKLRVAYPNVSIITQNVDRLHIAAVSASSTSSLAPPVKQRSPKKEPSGEIAMTLVGSDVKDGTHARRGRDNGACDRGNGGAGGGGDVERIVEAHGAMGEYRCVAPECVFTKTESFTATLGSAPVRTASAWTAIETKEDAGEMRLAPSCPACGEVAMPLVLLLDEEYTCHAKFRWKTIEQWVQAAEAIVFVGTSLSVGLTRAVQKWAGETKAAVYHFNLEAPRALPSLDVLQRFMAGDIDIDDACKLTADAGPHYIVGKCEHTLPHLARLC